MILLRVALNFVKQDQIHLQSVVNLPSAEAILFWVLSNFLWITRFSTLVDENTKFPIFVWVPGIVPSSHVGWFFSQPWLIASYVCAGQYLVKDLRTLCRSLELPFFETHSFMVLCPVNSIFYSLPEPPALFPQEG